MIILKKSKYQQEQRQLVDSLLDIRYSKNGASLDKQHVAFNTAFNITEQNNWSISFICSVDSFARTSTISNTTFGSLLSKQEQVLHAGVWKLKGLVIAYRKNNTQTQGGVYGNLAMPMDRYRLELMVCDGVSFPQQWSRTGFHFSKDALLHIVVTCQNFHQLSTYKIFVNSVIEPLDHYYTTALDPAGVKSLNDYKIGYAEFDMGSSNLNSYGFNGHLSHPLIFSKILSEKEILALHATGGIVPASAHAYVQAHLPLTQSSGKTVYNAVEQYNYAKQVTITATHGQLGNYSDIEAGIPTISTQTAYREFYNRAKNIQPFYFYAKNWRGNTSSTGNLALHPDYFRAEHGGAAHEWGTQDFEVEMVFALSRFDFAQNVFYKPVGVDYFNIGMNGSYIAIVAYYGGVFGRIETVQSPVDILTPNKFHTYIFRKITNNVNNWQVIVDGVLLEKIVASNSLAPSQNLSGIGSTRFFANNDMDTGDRELMFKECKLSIGGNLVSHWIANQRGGAYIPDQKGIVRMNMEHRVNPEYTVLGGRAWREEKSNAIPVIHALRFTPQTLPQHLIVSNFNPTKELGYTTIIGFALPTNRLFNGHNDAFLTKYAGVGNAHKIYRGVSSSKVAVSINTNAAGVGNALVSDEMHNTNRLQLLVFRELNHNGQFLNDVTINGFSRQENTTTGDIIGWDECNQNDLQVGTEIISNRKYDGYLFYIAIAKGIATDEQIQALNNNLFYLNPNPAWENLDWQLIVNFNRINVSGTTYTLEDLSGKGHSIQALNFTAANLDPVDPSYALISIDSLR